MGTKSSIEWTEFTWNPVVGCTKLSAGCKHCYAETMSRRLRAMGAPGYEQPFTTVRLMPGRLDEPRERHKPSVYFVNSMSDLFHENVPLAYIQQVFRTMADCPQHVFQVLTKRSERLAELAPFLPWPSNVWMGVSVEDARVLHRVDDLRRVPAAVRFLSCEPLIGSLATLRVDGIHWVIVGGESGPGARHMDQAWVDEIIDICFDADVAFFFKQWGGVRKSLAGRTLNGRTYDAMPRRAVGDPALA